ncbi:DUF4105 domain-containing protein [Deltaproteobacteria bacterium TL4]
MLKLRHQVATTVILFLISSLVFLNQPLQCDAQESAGFLKQIIHQVRAKKLYEQRYWHLLLHYHSTFWGGILSEVDDPGFFLSPNGRDTPQAEMEATLTFFFSEELVTPSQQQAICAFPARYHWLKKELEISDSVLPARVCPQYEKRLGIIKPEAVTLIFPSVYLNNPASMFGHTFLRIEQQKNSPQVQLLSYAVNYAAEVNLQENEVGAILKGVFGGFSGYFSLMPYYLKVQEYNELENRDMWEYRLNFDHEQRQWMLWHIWELGNARFDYFFFKENCSYHLLSLLDVANPELKLQEHFWLRTIPSDTIRLIDSYPGLILERNYRPSRSTQIQRKNEQLSASEYPLLLRILDDHNFTALSELEELPPIRQALILEIAESYLRYRLNTKQENKTAHKKLRQALLIARSQLKVKSPESEIKPYSGAPEEGHRVVRMGFGIGQQNQEAFEEIEFKASYHDLLDRETGYTPGAQIGLFNFQFRNYAESEQTILKKFIIAEVISLTPISRMFLQPSWKFNVQWENTGPGECSFCRLVHLNGGGGASFQTHLFQREVFYAFAEADLHYGEALVSHYQLGLGGTTGVLMDLRSFWKVNLFVQSFAYPTTDQANKTQISLQQNIIFSTNFAFRFEVDSLDNDYEGKAAVLFYF